MSTVSSKPHAHHSLRILIGSSFVLLSAFLFAIKAILIKSAYHLDSTLSAPALLALRMGSALPFFLAIAYFSPSSGKSLGRQDWGLLLFAGLIGYYLASILDFFGLLYISASLERIILFLYPTLTVVMTALLKRRMISPRVLAAIVLSYGGTIVVMLDEGAQAHQHPHQVWIGSLLVFTSAVAYATYLVMTPTLIQRFGSWRFTGLAMSIACLASLLHYVVTAQQPLHTLIEFSPSVWELGIMLGIFSTVLPATFLMQGIARVGASQAALLSAGGPIITVVLAVLFLGEQLSSMQWIGCALNMAGVLMITLWPVKPAAQISTPSASIKTASHYEADAGVE